MNDVYIGDNTHIENCIVESRDTIRANSFYRGEDEIKIVIEKTTDTLSETRGGISYDDYRRKGSENCQRR